MSDPWSFTSLLPNSSPSFEMVILGADPSLGGLFTPDEADALSRTHPHIKTRIVTGASHLMFQDIPVKDRVVDEILGHAREEHSHSYWLLEYEHGRDEWLGRVQPLGKIEFFIDISCRCSNLAWTLSTCYWSVIIYIQPMEIVNALGSTWKYKLLASGHHARFTLLSLYFWK